MSITTINPSIGEILENYNEMDHSEVNGIIDSVHDTFLYWRDTRIEKRTLAMQNLARLLRKDAEKFAKLITTEMGKPITQSKSEIEKCAFNCDYYAKNADIYLKPRVVTTSMTKSFVTYQPLGVVFAIMPWNFPFWQVFRFAVPNLMAGNAAILKHAPISTGASLAIEKLFLEAGFPENLFRSIIIDDTQAESVISHPNIIGVTLTGSPRAGRIVGAQAAKELKPSVLELGGSDPCLILEDADLDLAAQTCVESRLNNAGQVCVAAKRIVVLEKVSAAFVDLLDEKLQKYQCGDPLHANTNLGPLAREDIRENVHQQVMQSIAQGAQLKCGGVIPKGSGFYYPATLLTHVVKNMPAYDEEIFGPVLAVIVAKDETQAIEIANDTRYGLGAAIFSQDIKRAEKIAVEKIQAGVCAINTLVASDPRLPFGGIKGSGYGRELAMEGMHAFLNIKTINIK